MRKHLFDRSLYLDALRQLKFIGVACFCRWRLS